MDEEINRAMSYISQIFKNDFSLLKHSLDVYCLTKNLYLELPDSMKSKLDMTNLLTAAMLHDIGKISISRNLLQKPCELTDDEKKLIKYHAVYGEKMLMKTGFENIANLVLYHHEREDGEGYFFLTKEQTPVESKIIAVTDTFSALTSTRVYRRRVSVNSALKTIKDVSGTQLDENISSVFCNMVKNQGAFRCRFELYRLLIPLFLKAHFYFHKQGGK